MQPALDIGDGVWRWQDHRSRPGEGRDPYRGMSPVRSRPVPRL